MSDDSKPNALAEAFAALNSKPVGKPRSSPELVVNRDAEPYLAFDAKDRMISLDIRCGASGFACVLAYSPTMYLTYNYKTFTEIFIVAGTTCVTVIGERLHPVINSLRQQTCSHLQAFDASTFAPPPDPDAPYIERIDVQTAPRRNFPESHDE